MRSVFAWRRYVCVEFGAPEVTEAEARQAPEFTPLVRVSDVVKEAGRRRDLEDKRLQDWITVQLARLGFVRAPLPPGAARRA